MNKVLLILGQKNFLKIILVGFVILAGGGFFYAARADQIEYTYYLDADGDNYGTAVATTTLETEAPAGYARLSGDCADTVAAIHPGAAEACDNIDNDCDGVIDEGVLNTYYRDADGDTYGFLATTTEACSIPAGYVATSTDCDDNNTNIRPGAAEVCGDQKDNDCDASVDESCVLKIYYRDADGDTYGNSSATTTAYETPAGYVDSNSDCNDTKAAIHPGATEICDNIDNDCDASVDENLEKHIYYSDHDGDGFGGTATASACVLPAGYAHNNTDCNDLKYSVHPGATEFNDDMDNDCDGVIDEGFDNSQATSTCPCASQLGAFVSCFTQYLNGLKDEDKISGREKGQILRGAIKNIKAAIKSRKDEIKTQKKEIKKAANAHKKEEHSKGKHQCGQ